MAHLGPDAPIATIEEATLVTPLVETSTPTTVDLELLNVTRLRFLQGAGSVRIRVACLPASGDAALAAPQQIDDRRGALQGGTATLRLSGLRWTSVGAQPDRGLTVGAGGVQR
jgi:hypothetical protein